MVKCVECGQPAEFEFQDFNGRHGLCLTHKDYWSGARPITTHEREGDGIEAIEETVREYGALNNLLKPKAEPTPPTSVDDQSAGGLELLRTRIKDINKKNAKADLSLIPGPSLKPIARALGEGIEKYGRDDWRRSDLDLQEYASKAIGHIYEWLEGRDGDAKSGECPLAHAAADLAIILWHLQNGSGKQNRPAAEVSE